MDTFNQLNSEENGDVCYAHREELMTKINVTTRSGETRSFAASEGLSVMEIIRDGGIDELLALCGGCRSCATCHVHVDPEDFDKLDAMSDDENELLEGSSTRDATSRLSCQIPFSRRLDGLRVTIAAED
ncbi:2Fe-2S iron-sulfur cluster-binding protein [Mesorhizobium kowhaii]|nr:2Fe-2S iron-sulfur cluster-binding protein [Mesorhizobium kowhaii]